jgi:hypothetical protein
MHVKESESNFNPAPQGLQHAVCFEIRDLGMTETPWGKKPLVLIVWQLGESDPESGRRYFVFKRYNATLGKAAKPSNLREDLESWRGRAFTEAEAKDFDLDVLVGKNCQLSIVHNLKDGNTYANVKTVVPPPKNVPLLAVVEYAKQEEKKNGSRPPAPAPTPTPAAAAVADPDDDCPF